MRAELLLLMRMLVLGLEPNVLETPKGKELAEGVENMKTLRALL